ncbi:MULTISPECIES: hypothetical protein [unclassified Tolypothrix]|nr:MULTISPECIES: hypothetical protein [unclassified Tolypothrix]
MGTGDWGLGNEKSLTLRTQNSELRTQNSELSTQNSALKKEGKK